MQKRSLSVLETSQSRLPTRYNRWKEQTEDWEDGGGDEVTSKQTRRIKTKRWLTAIAVCKNWGKGVRIY